MVPPLVTLEEHFFSSLVLDNHDSAYAEQFKHIPSLGAKLRDLSSLRLKDMDAGGVTLQVISHGPVPGELALTPEQCRAANEQLSEAISAHPRRFAGFAVLPMRDPDAASKELAYCVEELGFVGALIDNHTNGAYYHGSRYTAFWYTVQSLGVPIYLHPTWPTESMSRIMYGAAEKKKKKRRKERQERQEAKEMKREAEAEAIKRAEDGGPTAIRVIDTDAAADSAADARDHDDDEVAGVDDDGFEGIPEAASVSLGSSGFGWHSDTALHVLKLFAAGIFDKFPRLKLVVGHMGEMLPFMLDRISSLSPRWGTRDRLWRTVYDENLWITTSGVWSVDPMACLLRNTKIERILYSVDYPFASNEAGLKFVEDLEKSGLVNQLQLEQIAYKNAEALLGIRIRLDEDVARGDEPEDVKDELRGRERGPDADRKTSEEERGRTLTKAGDDGTGKEAKKGGEDTRGKELKKDVPFYKLKITPS